MNRIELAGRLDEHARLPKIQGHLEGRLDIDLEKVESVNSVGCRSWIQWIQCISAEDGVYLHNCPSHFIAQVSILFGFIPPGVVIQSFYVPYYCDSCGAEERQLVQCGREVRTVEDLKISDEIICPICSAAMRLDVVKPKFLNFLNNNAA